MMMKCLALSRLITISVYDSADVDATLSQFLFFKAKQDVGYTVVFDFFWTLCPA